MNRCRKHLRLITDVDSKPAGDDQPIVAGPSSRDDLLAIARAVGVLKEEAR